MDIIGKKYYFLILSALIIIPGIISLIMFGLRPGLDFTGGSLIEFKNANLNNKIISEIKNEAENLKINVSSIQTSGKDSVIIKMSNLDKSSYERLKNNIKKNNPKIEESRFENVGPSVGKETTQKAIYSVLIASIMIIIYISFSFRKIPKPYSSIKFGICAVIALLHDVLLVLELFSIFGHFFHIEIDSLFITALLTVMGFSVHDSIVVFDRIRENLIKWPEKNFSVVVNDSIVQTLARSLSTSLTVIFTLSAMLFFGGESIRHFILALLIGIISGTYSSVFNAAPILVIWEEKK